MFSSRKLLEPPCKRSNGFLSPHTGPTVTAPKRQRLDWPSGFSLAHGNDSGLTKAQHDASRDGGDTTAAAATVLVETPECVITRDGLLPTYLCDEIRHERPTVEQVVHCRVAVPHHLHAPAGGEDTAAMEAADEEEASVHTLTGAHGGGGDRQVLSYYILVLRHRLVLWRQQDDTDPMSARNTLVTLPLPHEVTMATTTATNGGSGLRVHPFLFALYGARVSLMVVATNGVVLFWEDIDLPYESVPLSVQIPLQDNETVDTHPHASLVVANSARTVDEHKSIFCWSNQGNIWEIAMEDRRIRVRSFERDQPGFLTGLTKSVSQFFFARAAPPDVDMETPIQSVKIIPSASFVSGLEHGHKSSNSSNVHHTGLLSTGDAHDADVVDMLVLFANGTLERRSFNSTDVLDCACTSVWHFDANRMAITYFRENFPDFHLAKVFMVSLPYVSANGFGLLVAYVCTDSRTDEPPKVKYALFQFTYPGSSGRGGNTVEQDAIPEPAWACLLDYEPVFSELASSNVYIDVESIMITQSAMYLVWTQGQPVHFLAIQLPAPGQTTLRSRGFSLQGVEKNGAFGFSSRIEPAPGASVTGSVSFLLMDFDQTLGGQLCIATASNMLRLERQHESKPVAATANLSDGQPRRKRVDEAISLASEAHVLGENLSVQEYARLLMAHFDEYKFSSGPIRVERKDMPTLAQAAASVVYQILDAKASSGLRWGKEANDQTSSVKSQSKSDVLITPKLVRYQLEEKRSRHEEFITFLQQKCGDVWCFIEESADLIRYLVEGEEKLHAAISLCKFQGTIVATEEKQPTGVQSKITGQLLLRAIERTVEQRGYRKDQLRLAGYNAFDIFYCEVSKIDDLFEALRTEVHQLSSHEGETNPLYLHGLFESGYSMQSLAKAPTSTLLEPTGSWMFTSQIREAFVDHVRRLSSVLGYTAHNTESVSVPWVAEEVFEATTQIRKLGGLLLDAYSRFIPVTAGEEAQELKKEEDFTKRITLNALVYIATEYKPGEFAPVMDEERWAERQQTDLFADCIVLAEKYSYFEAMVYLAFKEEEDNLTSLDYILGRLPKSTTAKRVESYCTKFVDFTEFLLRWYGGEIRYPWSFNVESSRKRMWAYFLANSTTYGSSLSSYLKGHPELSRYSWLTEVSGEQYDQVARLTLNEAKQEQRLLSKRKTLTSIAQIAALATPAMPSPPSQQVTQMTEDIRRELATSRIQEILLELPIDSEIGHQPLAPQQLAEKSLDVLSAMARDDPLRTSVFIMALEALACLSDDNVNFRNACLHSWRRCIVVDSDLWEQLVAENESSTVNDRVLEGLIRDTLLFKTVRHIAAKLGNVQDPSIPSQSTGVTAEMIDEIVKREAGNTSIFTVQSRQVFLKALNLARSP